MKNAKRLFLAINLPPNAKSSLAAVKGRWYDFPARWAGEENMHITLAFLGNVREENVPVLSRVLGRVARRRGPFRVVMADIDYDTSIVPDRRHPRMIWARIGESRHLSLLYGDVKKALEGLPFKVHAQRPTLNPHITLARFSSMHLREWHGEELPPVEEELGIAVPVRSIELMESKLRRGGARHFVVQSYELAGDS